MNIKDLKKFGINGSYEGKLIIYIFSEFCGHCRLFSHVLEKLRNEDLIKLIQINIIKNQKLGQKLEISVIPTLFFFKDGVLLDKDIKVNGETPVKKGVMIGATSELILKDIIIQI